MDKKILTKYPNIDQIKEASKSISGRVVSTPVLELTGSKITTLLPKNASVRMKMELFQHTGSFKSRGGQIAFDKLASSKIAFEIFAPNKFASYKFAPLKDAPNKF